MLSINAAIRKAINKTGGDFVTVTLYLSASKEQITENQILETFKELEVLKKFQKLTADEKSEIIAHILSQKTDEKQIKVIVKQIDILSK